MSTAARSLIGCCLTQAELFKKQTVKAFEHDHPRSVKFDPETGRKLWSQEDVCILTPEIADLSCVEKREEIGGLYLFHDRSGWGEGSERYLLGDMALQAHDLEGGNDEAGFYAIEDPKTFASEVESVRERVKALLVPHKLWKPDRFGLWTLCYTGI